MLGARPDTATRFGRRCRAYPFDPALRIMSTTDRDPGVDPNGAAGAPGRLVLHVKGAPEEVLGRSTRLVQVLFGPPSIVDRRAATAVQLTPGQSAPCRPRIRTPIAVMTPPMTSARPAVIPITLKTPRTVKPPLTAPTIK
jgi:magnesium-transporting ATPase (P-type)